MDELHDYGEIEDTDDFEDALEAMISDHYEGADVYSFDRAGILTEDAGLVVEINGKTFFLTIS